MFIKEKEVDVLIEEGGTYTWIKGGIVNSANKKTVNVKIRGYDDDYNIKHIRYILKMLIM